MGAVVEDVIQTRLDLVGLGGWTRGIDLATQSMGVFTDELDAAGRATFGRAVTFGAVGLGIAAGLGKAVQAAGRMQTIQTAFTTLEGSAGAAKDRIAELQKFAASTPFDFEQSVRAAQRVRAMGLEGQKLIPVMQAVGNAVSAAGGDSETFAGVLGIIGQIKTKGKLQGDEILQLAERGIPATKILTRELGKTADQLTNLPADQVIDALVKGFNKDFGGAMEAQSKTLEGSLSNLGDASNQLVAAVGSGLVPAVTLGTQVLGGALGIINAIPEPVKQAAGPVLALAAAWSILQGIKLGKQALDLGKMAAENIQTANAANKAAQETASESGAVDKLGNSLKKSEADHQAVTRAIDAHTAALERLMVAANNTAGPVSRTAGRAVAGPPPGYTGSGITPATPGGKTAPAPAGEAPRPTGPGSAVTPPPTRSTIQDKYLSKRSPVVDPADLAPKAALPERKLSIAEPTFGDRARGAFGRAGQFLASERGQGALAGGAIAAGALVQMVPTEQGSRGEEAKNVLGSALAGAGLGAQIGSLIAPGIGTAVGAAVGGIGTAVVTYMSAEAERNKAAEPKPAESKESAKDEQIRLLKEQLEEMRKLRSGLVLDTDRLPGALQAGLAADRLTP